MEAITELNIDNLPFEVKTEGDHLVITSKPKAGWNRKKRKDWEKNPVKVKLLLFNDSYFERLNKIQVDYNENFSLYKAVKSVTHRITALIMK